MKLENIVFETKGTCGGRRNTKDVYIGMYKQNDKNRIQLSFNRKSIDLIDSEFIKVSKLTTIKGGKIRLYFMPATKEDGYKLTETKSTGILSYYVNDKDAKAFSQYKGESFDIIYDTECRLFFIEVCDGQNGKR